MRSVQGPKSVPEPLPAGSDSLVRQQARALGVPSRYDLFGRIAGATVPVTVAELTAATGLHHNAVRQHLAVLVDARLVEADTEPPGRRGRPRLRYRLAAGADGRWLRVGPYERLARLLLDVIRTGDSPFEVGRREGRREMAGVDAPTPLDALIETMAGHGFAPSTVVSDHDTLIVLDLCPYVRAAAVDPATVCDLHLGLAHGVADVVGGIEIDELVANDPHDAGCVLRCRTTGAEPATTPH